MNYETHRMVAVGVRLTVLGVRHLIVPKEWNAQQIEAYIPTLGDPSFDINRNDDDGEEAGQLSLLTNDETAVCSFDQVDSVEYVHPIVEVLEEHEILAMENHPDFVDDEETIISDEGVVDEESDAPDSEPQEPLRS